MIISDLFWRQIKELAREVRTLKTAHIKTATTLTTITKEIDVNFSLTLDSLSGNIFSSHRAVITANIIGGGAMVASCYLKNATPSNIDNRFIEILRLSPTDNVSRFGVAVTAGNASDFETLSQGGTVNLTYTIQIVGTSNFGLNLEYHTIDGGTT